VEGIAAGPSSIAHYKITAKLGEGGMGEVYRATDTKLGREVAIKILPDALAQFPDRLARFAREARVLASLNHPNIAAIYGVEERALVMELVEGPTLEERIAQGPIPFDEALPIARQVAEALEYAHEHGVTHRDLKPANVKLAGSQTGAAGRVKVLDFGLAKAAADERPPLDPESASTVTREATVAGVVMGTPAYMSPEQAQGKPTDRRTDIWSFGMVLAEKRLPLATLIAAEADLTSLPPDTPPGIRRLLRRCLTRDPLQRLQWIGEARVSIEQAIEHPEAEEPTVAAPARQGMGYWLPWALAAAGILAAATLGWMRLRERPAPAAVARFDVALPPKTTYVNGPRISPDGSKALMWLREQSGGWRYYVYSVPTGEFHVLTGTEQAGGAGWAPDSGSIVFNTGTELRKLDLASGANITLANNAGGGAAAWGADGAILYHDADGDISRVGAEGGESRKVLRRGAGENPYNPSARLLDGRQFLFSFARGASDWETRVGYLRGGGVRPLLRAATPGLYAGGGYVMFIRGSTLMAQPFDARRGVLSGSPAAVVGVGGPTADRTFAVSESGVLMFRAGVAAPIQNMTWFDRAGRSLGAVGDPDAYSNPALSPDGNRLAVAIGDPGARLRDIWVFDLMRGTRSRLTFDPKDDFNPVWSPDGQSIAFSSDRKGHRDIYRKPASGTGEDELLIQSNEEKNLEDWSRDGQRLFLNVQTPGAGDDIYSYSLAERKLEKFVATRFTEDKAHPSPDGHWLAYRSNESGETQVYIQPFPPTGGKWQVSTKGGDEPQWRADGKELFYVAGDVITAADIKTAGNGIQIGVPHALFQTKLENATRRNRYLATADGQRFLVLVPEDQREPPGFTVIVNWPSLLPRK